VVRRLFAFGLRISCRREEGARQRERGITSIPARRGAAILALVILLVALPITSAEASKHPTYPLGSAASCKAHYVERILKHKVNGKTISYIACVYVAPRSPAALAHTVTSAPPGKARPVPKLIGDELDLAEATLLSDGLGYKVFGGGIFGIIVASDWTVCSQSPPPGTTANAVKLVVARSCS
jgi:hypothetical protein